MNERCCDKKKTEIATNQTETNAYTCKIMRLRNVLQRPNEQECTIWSIRKRELTVYAIMTVCAGNDEHTHEPSTIVGAIIVGTYFAYDKKKIHTKNV